MASLLVLLVLLGCCLLADAQHVRCQRLAKVASFTTEPKEPVKAAGIDVN